ncbi:MAG: uncharacterized protein JWP21_2224 [Tardiphaga sp.]|nr:uncharacterized protein [Tardiphaga sp.]MDB5548777.1 uncharacterized protein [Tardiphaga sp.]MDB5629685.1 uncharacterized protein [Tardiphaga sp.]
MAKGTTNTVLHRDIFWLGRQWCVTGFGIQVIDKKLKMRFDIPASKIWEDDLTSRLLLEPWFDADDFAEALALARLRAQDNPKIFAPPLTNER